MFAQIHFTLTVNVLGLSIWKDLHLTQRIFVSLCFCHFTLLTHTGEIRCSYHTKMTQVHKRIY